MEYPIRGRPAASSWFGRNGSLFLWAAMPNPSAVLAAPPLPGSGDAARYTSARLPYLVRTETIWPLLIGSLT